MIWCYFNNRTPDGAIGFAVAPQCGCLYRIVGATIPT
jgi:hypothetical protein